MSFAQYIPMALDTVMSLSSLFGGHENSARTSYNYSRALQQHQYELNRQSRQTVFGDTRKSLVDADYNPLLAVGQQAQGGTFGASMSVQDPKTERLQNRIAQATAFGQLKLNSATAFNQFMQGRLTTAQANNLMTQSKLNSAQTSLTNLQSNRQAIENLYLPDKLKSEIKLNNNNAQALMINAESNRVSALAKQMDAESNRITANTNSAVGASTAWRNYNSSLGFTTHGQIGPFSFSHTGNPNSYTEIRNGKWDTRYETINGRRVPVRTYVRSK